MRVYVCKSVSVRMHAGVYCRGQQESRGVRKRGRQAGGGRRRAGGAREGGRWLALSLARGRESWDYLK